MRNDYFDCQGKRLLVGLLGMGSVVLGLSGCSDTTSPNVPLTATQAYWTLQLNQHAVMLSLEAPTSTIQLQATPLNAQGEPLNGLGSVQYIASDSSVDVDSSGLVTAKFQSKIGPTLVIASLRDSVQRVTLWDTCFIQVTATAPAVPLTTFSIQPTGRDSARRSLNISYTVKVNALDSKGKKFTPLLTYFSSSDPSVTTFDNRLSGKTRSLLRTGTLTFYATTWAYGVALQDSLPFTVTIPTTASVFALSSVLTGSSKPVLTFWPAIVTVGTGARVSFENDSYTDSIDVVFDDPSNVQADTAYMNQLALLYGYVFPISSPGNVAPFFRDTTGKGASCGVPADQRTTVQDSTCKWIQYNAINTKRYRLFSVAGTYHYHSMISGSTGTIVVQ